TATPRTEAQSIQSVAAEQPARRLASFPFRNWITYYGRGQVDALVTFDLINVDLEPRLAAYSAAEIQTLRQGLGARGGKLLSYLNVGACENTRGYWSRTAERRQAGCQAFVLQRYRGYPGEFWMDVRNPGYQDLIVDVAARALVERGADGFVLDN